MIKIKTKTINKETADNTMPVSGDETIDCQLTAVLQEYKDRKGSLIAALQKVQQIYGYLSREVLIKVAYELNIPLAEVYSVVSFYSLFSTEPVGEIPVEVCMGTACYVKKAGEIYQKLSRELGIKDGEVTPDGKYSLGISRCVGACSCAPVVKVGDDLKGNAAPDNILELLPDTEQ